MSGAVFLSYASEDAEAAERIATALRGAGVEVWFDKSELVGGDAWDAKIRQQIKECTLFVPIISANTQAREEGYFRLEWHLAEQRTYLMAHDKAFLFPIVVDGTTDAAARVPDRFRERQWMRLDQTSPESIAKRLSEALAGKSSPVTSTRSVSSGRPPLSAKDAASEKSSWAKWLWIGVPAVVISLAFGFWLVIDQQSDPRDLKSGEATATVESVSEAARLASRADELVTADSLSRADLETAFELCEQAAQMEPLNAEVWATWSRVCAAQVFYRFDNTTENTVRAEDYAAKAVRLNPESIEARFAQVNYWLTVAVSLNGFNPDLFRQAFEMLEQMHAESPDDPRILQSLGGILASIPETRERGMQMIDKLTTIPGWKERGWNGYGWMQFFSGKYDLAQEAATKGLTEKNHPPILVLNTMLAMHWSGDLDAALAFLNRLSPATQREDWLLALRVRLLMWRGEPAGILQRLNQHPRDWIDSQIFDGPKSWWIGEANRKLDRPMAAEQSYQTALRLIDVRLSDAPQDPNLLSLKIWVLHRLGQREESQKVYDLMVENQWDWFGVHALFEPEKILAEFETTFDHPDLWRTASALRHLEWYEPVRDTPEFQALLARAEASPKHTPNPTQPFPADPQLKQAYDLVNALEANPGDYLLAEEIVTEVLEDDPLDPEANITMAWIQVAFNFRGFDRSNERQAKAQRFAERASRLAPDNAYALLALGAYQGSVIRDNALAETTLQRAAELNPNESLIQRFLDESRWRQDNHSPDELIAMVERTAARFPQDPLNHYSAARVYRNFSRPAEMETALDRTLALYPIANARIYKARLALMVRGDLDEMAEHLDQVSDRMRNTERVVVTRVTHALLSGQFQEGLDALERFLSPWIEDNDFVGPKALLEAILLEADGRHALAQRQALAATQVLQEYSDFDVIRQSERDSLVETWAYWMSGKSDLANQSLDLALEGLERPYRLFPLTPPWDSALALCLIMDRKETALQLLEECLSPPRPDEYLVANVKTTDAYVDQMNHSLQIWFALDPRMEPWRNDPEILAILGSTDPIASR